MDEDPQALLDKVIKIIESSDLGEEEKDMLAMRVPFLEDKSQAAFVKLCTDDPSLLNMLVDNLKMKLEAQDNPDKISEIVEKEREELTRIINED